MNEPIEVCFCASLEAKKKQKKAIEGKWLQQRAKFGEIMLLQELGDILFFVLIPLAVYV